MRIQREFMGFHRDLMGFERDFIGNSSELLGFIWIWFHGKSITNGSFDGESQKWRSLIRSG